MEDTEVVLQAQLQQRRRVKVEQAGLVQHRAVCLCSCVTYLRCPCLGENGGHQTSAILTFFQYIAM